MSTLKPLIESSSSDRARLLLRAARADGPRHGAAGRTLAALGVVGTAATAAGAATAAAGATGLGTTASASLPLIAAKWLIVGTLCGGALASGAAFVFSPAAPSAAAPKLAATPATSASTGTGTRATSLPAAPRQPVSVTAEPAPEPETVVLKPVKTAVSAAVTNGTEAAPSRNVVPAPFTAPSQATFESPEQSKLLHDVALLDDARRALKASDSAHALTLLTRYDAERQTHILDREAQLLHIDVLTAQGERAAARQLAQKYLASFPNDAHAERLRALVASDN